MRKFVNNNGCEMNFDEKLSDEIDICDNCKASIISNNDIPPNF